jgi:hypothetical protein
MKLFSIKRALIGVVHLAPLPGAPGWSATAIDAILDAAVRDARVYQDSGFDAVIVENFGDAPFFKNRVPRETVAALGVAARAVRENVKIPCGVNCLRNDGLAAIAVAAAANCGFVRINILTGAAATDQGIVEGEAAEVLRLRARLAPDVKIFADVLVKHASPIAPRPIDEEIKDCIERGGANAVIVSGARTGSAPDVERLEAAARAAANRAPLLIGSGLTAENATILLAHSSGAIVGTSVKRDGITHNPVEPSRARSLVRAVRAM